MGIRKACIDDCKQISLLLNQLDYPNTEPFLKEKVQILLMDPNEELLVFEEEKMSLPSFQFILYHN